MKRLTAALIVIVAALVMGISAAAEPFAYSTTFAPNAWKPDAWIMVKSPRWDYMGTWVQRPDHILNATPPGASDADLLGPKASETYTSMVLKQRVGGTVTITTTLSFDDRMAPLIVLADTLGEDGRGRPEYRNHTEIVAFDDGINIWQHYYREGKPSWVKLAWTDFKLKPRVKYPMKVEITGKQIKVTIAGHTLGCTNPDLPPLFHAGITACEGKNRFYDFRVEAK